MADVQDGKIKVTYVPGGGRGKYADVVFTIYDSPFTKALASLLNIGVGESVSAAIGGEKVYIRHTGKPNNQIVISRTAQEKAPETPPEEGETGQTESISGLKFLQSLLS